jgi:hypothetical protein
VVALVVQLLLNMLGIGLGVATLDLMTGDSPELRTFSIFAAIWWTVCDIIVAARDFCRSADRGLARGRASAAGAGGGSRGIKACSADTPTR